MNVLQRLAQEDIADMLMRRRDDDDAALREAFELAAQHDEHDGAERLRRFALETYT